MPATFSEAYARVKQLVADFRANEIVASSLWLEFIGAQRRHYTHRCDGLDRQIDALVYDLYALTPTEIKIVEGNPAWETEVINAAELAGFVNRALTFAKRA